MKELENHSNKIVIPSVCSLISEGMIGIADDSSELDYDEKPRIPEYLPIRNEHIGIMRSFMAVTPHKKDNGTLIH